ncbi:hypothetical protein [Hymenobacter cellulosivorans]|uniref:DUF4435 domain-containing protein n=1 Tax=Hymenobacter cellulosivorans TaxID=2932249 RepID=A0ABY4F9I8_9BACT|nr:hypothetical protein [Hymenobacter cellulosivorans]UOQ53090.1 hypothetical protein MUN80_25550 [Hymenobacter cellulosivorans]
MTSKKANTSSENQEAEPKTEKLGHCGVIIPISDTAGYVSGHWQQVLNLVKKAANESNFTCEIVSDNSFSNVMHANIITNIFSNDIVICDVSSFNSNVMLELGLRLASKKPLIIIYDGEGNYPFDMNQLFYEKYDKGLRYYDTEDFINRLSKRITNTYLSTLPESPTKYKPYLDYFSDIQIEPADINRQTVGLTEAIELLTKQVNNSIALTQNNSSIKAATSIPNSDNIIGTPIEVKNFVRNLVSQRAILSWAQYTNVRPIIYQHVISRFNWTDKYLRDHTFTDYIDNIAKLFISEIRVNMNLPPEENI